MPQFLLDLYKNNHNMFSSLIDAVLLGKLYHFLCPNKIRRVFISLYLLYCSGREELLPLKISFLPFPLFISNKGTVGICKLEIH